jgi:3-oxoacyl-[acyl-carrier protein] reductase
MDLQLRGKAVLITGGSRGIGRQIALTFAEEGAKVAICGRDQSQLDKTAQEIRDRGAEALGLRADLVDPGSAQHIVDETAAAFGGLNVLICSSSTGAVVDLPTRFEDTDDEQLMEHVYGKALPALRCTRAAIPHMRRTGGGAILYIVGTATRTVFRGMENRPHEPAVLQTGLGCAMLTNFAKQVGEQVAGDSIMVNVIHPHITRTDRFAARIKMRAAYQDLTPEASEADMASYIPIGRILEPSDLAPLAVLLSSPLAGAITGQTIAVDGGACRTIIY